MSNTPSKTDDSDLPPAAGGNLPEYSVSEISAALKKTVESNFSRVRIRGEISGFKRAASGHLYMTLKDENAVLDGVCWRGSAGKLATAPEDGLEVIVEGRLTTYPGRSKYQIVIEAMELAGEGALLKLLEERKRKLAAEGLFDPAAKKELPFLPEVIGIVTSPTGAVIRDILHRLDDRFPRRVLLWPVLVQGEGAAEQVASAIKGFNAITGKGKAPRPDLLIVARGGGSLEDLWAFNEEVVVRAAALSDIPLISAVGHEPDVTLIDFAADRRAPTPSAAAEMAVPVRVDLLAGVMEAAQRLFAATNRIFTELGHRIEGLGRGLPEPRRLLETAEQRLDDKGGQLSTALTRCLKDAGAELERLSSGLRGQTLLADFDRRGERLSDLSRRFETATRTLLTNRGTELKSLAKLLESFSYRNVLKRGFTVVRNMDGVPLTSAAAAVPGLDVMIEFQGDDSRPATIKGEDAPKPKAAKRTRPGKSTKSENTEKKGGDDPQGNLL